MNDDSLSRNGARLTRERTPHVLDSGALWSYRNPGVLQFSFV